MGTHNICFHGEIRYQHFSNEKSALSLAMHSQVPLCFARMFNSYCCFKIMTCRPSECMNKQNLIKKKKKQL